MRCSYRWRVFVAALACSRGTPTLAAVACASQAACVKDSQLQPEAFPKDHLRDIFSSWAPTTLTMLAQDFKPVGPPVLLVVTRERYVAGVDACARLTYLHLPAEMHGGQG